MIYFNLIALCIIVISPTSSYQTVKEESLCVSSSGCGEWGSSKNKSLSDMLSSDTCNIQRVNNISQEQFLRDFAYNLPVIFVNVTNNAHFQELCRKGNLLQSYGDRTITLSTANTHSYDKVYLTFTEYMEQILRPQDFSKSGQETLYFFGNHDYSKWEDLFQHYVIPPYELPNKSPALSFGIAGAGTGVPFHFHGPGFAEVIHGRKRWFLSPFNQKPSFDPDKTTFRWFVEDYETATSIQSIHECVLNPGEVIYFPDKWWHATLNVEDSVFMSTFLG